MSRKLLLTIVAVTLAFVGLTATGASASVGQYPPTTDGGQVGGDGADNGGGDTGGAGANAGGSGGGGTADGGSGAPLPRTGTDIAPFVLIGLVLIGAGAFTLVATMRRREPAAG
ncbi:MAG TPA: LPXTG cell wall anchor domain-containing protein [Aquihabitans sp.]|jgi:LPXTG-motif cell wall-anchored protein|nr:LPXTG cell wall anchor domain-containing protein [Aquihabitans sp.]